MLASNPTCLGVVEYTGEFSWFRARKTPMTIIQKYRYGLSEPCAGKDQVNGVISIDVTRFDAQAARGRDQLNGLVPCGRELKFNPVGAAAAASGPGLNAG